MELKKTFERIRTSFSAPEKRNRLLILVGVIGVLLLLLSEAPGIGNGSAEPAEADGDLFSALQESTQRQLQKLIENVDGAGKTLVMVSFETNGEYDFATDKKTESAVGERTTESAREESVVLVDGSSGDTGLLLKTVAPTIRGVAVVCEGGGSAAVKREVTEIIRAALGIGREKIHVAKMKSDK